MGRKTFAETVSNLSSETWRRPMSAALRPKFNRWRRDGLPNYFDDQRFGSLGYSGQFIAHAWLVGDHERALKLALAEANPFDRSAAKAQKAVLREWWGRWTEAKARLERSSARSIVTYLVDHPTDFRGAFARLRREFRTLYFSAFQSHLWNLILARWIERSTSPDQRVILELKGGRSRFLAASSRSRSKSSANRPFRCRRRARLNRSGLSAR